MDGNLRIARSDVSNPPEIRPNKVANDTEKNKG